MKNLTVVILARNEEANLKQLLPTLKFADEILVIDDTSLDQTYTVAKKLGAKCLINSLKGNFAEARNFGLKEAKNEWVLFLDADEKVDSNFVNWVSKLEPETNLSAYRFRRQDWFWNKPVRHGEMGNVWVTRLVKKGTGKFKRPVHEIWVTTHQVLSAPVTITHYPHPTIKEFLEHINFYSNLNATYWHTQKKSVRPLTILIWPLGKFLQLFILRLGFLDGAPGFVYAFMMSFHSFLSRAKLYVMNQQ